MPKSYDAVVLGATPAGCAAAHALARAGHDVALVGAPAEGVECPLADWLGPGFFKLAGMPAGLARAAAAKPFRDVHYHNAALDKEVPHRSRSTAGYLVKADALRRAFRSAAARAGVTVRSTKTRPAIGLDEDGVRVTGTTQVRARVLLIADSRPAEVIGDLSLPMRTVPLASLVVAGLDVPLASAARAKAVGEGLHVVESGERTEMGVYFAVGNILHLRVISTSPAAGTRVAELSEMVAGLQGCGLLPAGIPLGKARGAVWRPPGGVALELETHVAKRCLLIGTAGGFAETITGQTAVASVRSALLGAEVAGAALKSKSPQESLMRYKQVWRRSLADFIRPPNTSLHMLLPLLFVNQRVVSRFTRALLRGENI